MTIEKFTVNVPEAALDDVKRRLDATRWPDELPGTEWAFGTNLAYMKSLVAYWRSEYDWRRQETALNRLPHYRIAIDGLRIHYIHVRGKGPSPMPLIITHGWPGSFVEMVKLIPLLTDPSVDAKGLCGLSGIGHGLMVISALESMRRGNDALVVRIGLFSLMLVIGKSLFEALTGKILLAFLYFNMVGDPVAATHAGGALGALVAWLFIERCQSAKLIRWPESCLIDARERNKVPFAG